MGSSLEQKKIGMTLFFLENLGRVPFLRQTLVIFIPLTHLDERSQLKSVKYESKDCQQKMLTQQTFACKLKSVDIK